VQERERLDIFLGNYLIAALKGSTVTGLKTSLMWLPRNYLVHQLYTKIPKKLSQTKSFHQSVLRCQWNRRLLLIDDKALSFKLHVVACGMWHVAVACGIMRMTRRCYSSLRSTVYSLHSTVYSLQSTVYSVREYVNPYNRCGYR
jgi:hypothetical protein